MPRSIVYLLMLAFSAQALAADAPSELVQARLVAEKAGVQRGSSAWLAVELDMKPGWHTYWRNPGDAGLPTTIKWTLPAEVTAGSIVWPIPHRFVSRSIVGFGYPDRVALLTQLHVPRAYAAKTLPVSAAVSWLACEQTCIPGSQTVTLTLPVTDAQPKANRQAAALFKQTREHLAKPAAFAATFAMDRSNIRLTLPADAAAPAGSSVSFYPYDSSLIEHAAPQRAALVDGKVQVTLYRSPVANDRVSTLDGLLMYDAPAAGAQKPRGVEVSAQRTK